MTSKYETAARRVVELYYAEIRNEPGERLGTVEWELMRGLEELAESRRVDLAAVLLEVTS